MANGHRMFLYVPAVDLSSMGDFYGEAVGLEESYFAEGTVSYVSPGMQFTIYSSDAEQLNGGGWAIQPG